MGDSKAVSKRRRRIKQMAVELLGGKCCRCGYDRCIAALHFHHIDRAQKSFGISQSGVSRSWKLVQEELKKCILLCANCHAEQESFLLYPGLNGRTRHC